MCVSASAGLYTYTATAPSQNSWQINTAVFQNTLAGGTQAGSTIEEITLTLNFLGANGLNGTTMNGSLYRDLAGNPSQTPVSFKPSENNGDYSFRLNGPYFAGMSPNTSFTLALSMPSGAGVNYLQSWSLQVQAVPEPANVALGVFGGIFGLVIIARSRAVRDRVNRWKTAAVGWINAV